MRVGLEVGFVARVGDAAGMSDGGVAVAVAVSDTEGAVEISTGFGVVKADWMGATGAHPAVAKAAANASHSKDRDSDGKEESIDE